MKIKSFTNYTYIIGVFMLFCMFSCQTEPLSIDENLTTASSAAKKSNDKSGGDIVWDECSTTANQVNLYAGQNTLVGNVTVTDDGVNYTITYNITDDGWCLTETHLSVVRNRLDFPLSGGGNPKNGHFEFGESLDCASSASYEVSKDKGTYIAAHAVVACKSEFTTNIESLPLEVSVCVTDKAGTNPEGGDSYFDITIGGDSFLAGDYNAWCIDLNKSLGNEVCFDANTYSMYNENLPDVFGKPENLGAVNWIVNQDFISQGYTFGEIQWAIWELLELDNNPSGYCCLGTWDEGKGNEIVEAAMENVDFEPSCGQLLGIAILPTDSEIQPVMITIPIPCDNGCEETAWGAANGEGCEFPGNNWATYFQYPTGG
jgi:hypothetical protein